MGGAVRQNPPIPRPTVGNAGEFVGVTESGAYALLEVIGSGTEFPATPGEGALFHRTDRNVLYGYDGSAWVPIHAYGGMTLYVDENGSDTADGFSTVTAKATLAAALSECPDGATVVVNVVGDFFAGDCGDTSRFRSLDVVGPAIAYADGVAVTPSTDNGGVGPNGGLLVAGVPAVAATWEDATIGLTITCKVAGAAGNAWAAAILDDDDGLYASWDSTGVNPISMFYESGTHTGQDILDALDALALSDPDFAAAFEWTVTNLATLAVDNTPASNFANGAAAIDPYSVVDTDSHFGSELGKVLMNDLQEYGYPVLGNQATELFVGDNEDLSLLATIDEQTPVWKLVTRGAKMAYQDGSQKFAGTVTFRRLDIVPASAPMTNYVPFSTEGEATLIDCHATTGGLDSAATYAMFSDGGRLTLISSAASSNDEGGLRVRSGKIRAYGKCGFSRGYQSVLRFDPNTTFDEDEFGYIDGRQHAEKAVCYFSGCFGVGSGGAAAKFIQAVSRTFITSKMAQGDYGILAVGSCYLVPSSGAEQTGITYTNPSVPDATATTDAVLHAAAGVLDWQEAGA